jgi:hypothetical protein
MLWPTPYSLGHFSPTEFRTYLRSATVVKVRHLSGGILYTLIDGEWFHFAFRSHGGRLVHYSPAIAPDDVFCCWEGSFVDMVKKKFMPPAAVPKRDRQPAPDCLDGHFGDSFPQLWGYLSCSLDAAGSPRETATLNIFASPEGGFKGYLHDRQETAKLWAVADTFMGICERLETDLGDATAVWREDWAGRTGKRK